MLECCASLTCHEILHCAPFSAKPFNAYLYWDEQSVYWHHWVSQLNKIMNEYVRVCSLFAIWG